jgi:hypothetical protein
MELKRTEDGGHMELQVIRYAAMVSKMTFDKVVGSSIGISSLRTVMKAQGRLSSLKRRTGPRRRLPDRIARDLQFDLRNALEENARTARRQNAQYTPRLWIPF